LKKINLIGKKFNRLLVIEELEYSNGRPRWLCKCECGELTIVNSGNLLNNKVKSCGCLLEDKITKHGMTGTPEHISWLSMIDRCYNKNRKQFKYYGDRNIKVCERWKGNDGFENFYKDMGDRPYPKNEYSIDRINVDGDYEPNNCRWATKKEQSYNKRNNIKIKFNGVYKNIDELSKLLNIKKHVLKNRYYRGWTDDEITSGVKNEVYEYTNKILEYSYISIGHNEIIKVYNNGDVYRIKNNKWVLLKPIKLRDTLSIEYMINGKSYRIRNHVAVVKAFIFPEYIPKKYIIYFKDNNKENCSACNLKVVTKSQHLIDIHHNKANVT